MMRCLILLSVVLLGCGWSTAGSGQTPGASSDPPAPVVAHASDLQAALGRSRELENNDPQGAYQSARDALAAAREHRDRTQVLEALMQTARTAREVAAYTEADTLAADGLALASRLGNEAARGECFVIRGMVKWNLADLPAAMASFLDARAIADKLDRDDLRIGAESGLGLAYGRGEDHAEALVHFQNALHLAENRHDPRLASVLNYIGNNYLLAKDYPRARENFERSLALAKAANNQRLVAYITLNLGEIANRTGDQPQASKYLDDAMAVCRRYDLPRGIADAHYLFARIERSLGHPEAATQHLDAGMEIAAKLGNPDLFASYFEEYTLTREALGDYRGALDYARKLAEKTEEIRGERSRQQMAELQARYEIEARNRQIKLLERDAALRQSALDLTAVELSRTSARYYALGEIVVFATIIAGMFIARQRARVRRAGRMLAEVSAAKEVIEESAAQKSRLLDIAAHNLTESEALFRDAFVHSPLGLALVSTEGRWLRVNEALCQIVGYTEAELLATNFQAITHPDDLPADLDLLGRLLRGEIETYQLDKRYLHRRGHAVWIRLDVSLHRDAATGEPRHFISQVQDITGRQQAIAQLRQAKDEAEAASKAKNEFLSRMSHELRTPLNAILGFGQLLELQDLGNMHNQGVSYILTAGRHLLSLINEVLDLSSIESGKFTLTNEPMPVSELLGTTLEMMRPLAREASVSIVLENCPATCTILADPRRLKQVLLNLVSNAIKFNRPGGKVIVRCHEGDERMQIAVIDTGPGIAAADIDRIFAPFARLPATQEVPGTGLGLSLSKALTEAMGGTLTVNSEPGVGSTFTVEFPRVEHHETPPLTFEPIIPAASSYSRRTAAGFRRKVLYIEDDLTNLELIERLLALDQSLSLLTAARGKCGLEIARSERLDLILLDVHLGDMDGADVLRELRSDPATAEVPVVVVSADAMREQIDRMRHLGAQAYVTKPIDIEELRRTIDETIQAAVDSRSERDLHDPEHAEHDQIRGQDDVEVFRADQHEHAGNQRQYGLGGPGELKGKGVRTRRDEPVLQWPESSGR